MNWSIKGLKLKLFCLLLPMSLLLVSCSKPFYPGKSDPLLKTMQACSMEWGTKVTAKITAKFEDLKKGGVVEWEAAREAGGILLKDFKNDSIKKEVYDKYINCIKPAIEKLISSDQRPTVVLIGSKEDYTTYKMKDLEQTSVELLQKRFGNFNVLPFTVSYIWDNEESIREVKPAVIVIHASAFHNDQHKDEAISKFQALILSLYGLSETKFLVFSRLPEENPSPDLCQRWNRQVDFLSGKKFRNRLIFYPMPGEESNFTGKAGIEVSQIVRCLSGLEATSYSSVYLREIEKEAQQRILNSSCTLVRR